MEDRRRKFAAAHLILWIRMHVINEHIHECVAGRSPAKLTKFEAFLSGGLARTVAAAATCPFTLVKTRMEYTGGGRPVQVGPVACVSQQGLNARP